MIIIGYQGIGKSSLAGPALNCIDLESGNFYVDGERDAKWYRAYCQIATHLSQQGFTVFTSSHEVVRHELAQGTEPVCIICPSPDLKEEWIAKLRRRYEESHLEKDFRALANAQDRYSDNIEELLMSGIDTYVISDIDYKLSDIVENITSNMAALQRIEEEAANKTHTE